MEMVLIPRTSNEQSIRINYNYSSSLSIKFSLAGLTSDNFVSEFGTPKSAEVTNSRSVRRVLLRLRRFTAIGE